MAYSIHELEEKLKKTGSLLTIEQKDSKYSKRTFWIGWYRYKDTDDYNIILTTFSLDEESAKLKTFRYLEENPEYEFGVSMVDSKGNINIEKEEKVQKTSQNKSYEKHSNLPENIKKCINKNIIKNASTVSDIDQRSFVVLDTETTGLTKRDEVVELAAVKYKDAKKVDEFHYFIIPTVSMNPRAEATHGLSVDFLKAKGRPAMEVYGKFTKWLEDLPVCAHNFKFDKRMIEDHSARVKVPIKLKKAYCTLELSRKMMNLPSHKLEDIIDKFNLRKDLKSHSGMDDVVATSRYIALLNRVYKYICYTSVS